MPLSVENLLVKIQEKPGVYIGWYSVTRLRSFLDGYEHAIYEEYGALESPRTLRRFQNMLHCKHPEMMWMGWYRLLISLAGDEKRGLDLFWVLWSEFLQQPKDAYSEPPSVVLDD